MKRKLCLAIVCVFLCGAATADSGCDQFCSSLRQVLAIAAQKNLRSLAGRYVSEDHYESTISLPGAELCEIQFYGPARHAELFCAYDGDQFDSLANRVKNSLPSGWTTRLDSNKRLEGHSDAAPNVKLWVEYEEDMEGTSVTVWED